MVDTIEQNAVAAFYRAMNTEHKTTNVMTFEDFKIRVLFAVDDLAEAYNWRLGQSVFNLLDLDNWGKIARDVKEFDDVDCFYDDSKVEEFLKCAYNRLTVDVARNLKLI